MKKCYKNLVFFVGTLFVSLLIHASRVTLADLAEYLARPLYPEIKVAQKDLIKFGDGSLPEAKNYYKTLGFVESFDELDFTSPVRAQGSLYPNDITREMVEEAYQAKKAAIPLSKRPQAVKEQFEKELDEAYKILTTDEINYNARLVIEQIYQGFDEVQKIVDSPFKSIDAQGIHFTEYGKSHTIKADDIKAGYDLLKSYHEQFQGLLGPSTPLENARFEAVTNLHNMLYKTPLRKAMDMAGDVVEDIQDQLKLALESLQNAAKGTAHFTRDKVVELYHFIESNVSRLAGRLGAEIYQQAVKAWNEIALRVPLLDLQPIRVTDESGAQRFPHYTGDDLPPRLLDYPESIHTPDAPTFKPFEGPSFRPMAAPGG